jgi:hypothetical protein
MLLQELLSPIWLEMQRPTPGTVESVLKEQARSELQGKEAEQAAPRDPVSIPLG